MAQRHSNSNVAKRPCVGMSRNPGFTFFRRERRKPDRPPFEEVQTGRNAPEKGKTDMEFVTNLKLLAMIGAVGLGAGVAEAQDHRGPGPRMDFATLDADGSGEIDASDLEALRQARFAEIDTNGDGKVTQEEFVAHAAARSSERAAEMFARLDADGDGSLSRDALESRGRGNMGERLIQRADADGSGGVSQEEFDAAMERFAERRGGGKHGGKRRQ